MLVYFNTDEQARLLQLGRCHPWQETTKTPRGSYVDFKTQPDLIAETLEDLAHVAGTSAEKAIVQFITWANGPYSVFETNDFGLRPLKSNDSHVSLSKFEQHGRITLLFRDLKLNTQPTWIKNFLTSVEQKIKTDDPSFRQACWSWCMWPHLFVELANSGQPADGQCFMFHFWAWGDNAPEVHRNLARAFRNLKKALVAQADSS